MLTCDKCGTQRKCVEEMIAHKSSCKGQSMLTEREQEIAAKVDLFRPLPYEDVNFLLSTIQEIREEVERLNELKLHRMDVENGKLNFAISGEPAMAFAAILLRFFEDNGGKNFFSFDIERRGGEKFSITIQNLNGELTPAEKMRQQEDALNQLRQENERLKETLQQIGWGSLGMDENGLPIEPWERARQALKGD